MEHLKDILLESEDTSQTADEWERAVYAFMWWKRKFLNLSKLIGELKAQEKRGGIFYNSTET